MRYTKSAFVAATIMLSSVLTTAAVADEKNSRFEEVLDRGVLRVGVQGAFKPWSFRAPDGTMEGIEVDLAQTVADRMGVELELVLISSSNRLEFLQQGKIDLIIGAMSDRPDRRRVVGIVEPGYWSSGPALMARKGVIESWEDIRNKPVCGKQGTFHNKIAETNYGAKVIAFGGNTEAKEALRTGKCVAFVYDDTSLLADLSTPEWADYEMPVDPVFPNPWGVGIPLEEKDGIWGAFMSGMAYSWHADGTLLELEEKWGASQSKWLSEMRDKLNYDRSYLED